MSAHNRVIWSEGLFLQPQHFQQQERYFERYVEARCQALVPHSWGFTEIEFERDLLSIGKFGVAARGRRVSRTARRSGCRTTIRCPRRSTSDRTSAIRSCIWPCRCAAPGELEVDREAGGADELVRHDVREVQARNATSSGGDPALLEVGALRTRLLLASDVTEAYACVPLAHMVECRADKQVVLDDEFIPTVLHARTASRLATFTTELLGLLHQRGEALGGRVAATGRGAAAEFADFLMLQAINRYEPLLAHYAESGDAASRGAVSGLRVGGGRAGDVHDDVEAAAEVPGLSARSAAGVVRAGDRGAARIAEQGARAERHSHPDRAEEVRHQRRDRRRPVAVQHARSSSWRRAPTCRPKSCGAGFPAQLKIGPVEKIRDLVTLQLPGVPVHAVPVAPRQIPFHAGFVYFELDQTDELWEQLKSSGGVAHARRRRVPRAGAGVLGDPQLIRG